MKLAGGHASVGGAIVVSIIMISIIIFDTKFDFVMQFEPNITGKNFYGKYWSSQRVM